MNTNHIERKVHDQLGAFGEEPAAPERGGNREAPFGSAERGIQLTHLEQPNRRVVPVGNHREAQIAPSLALTSGPGNEALESVQCCGRR